MTILGDFLPVLLSNVPFDRTVTWAAHNICSWLAVAVLSVMTMVLIGVVVYMTTRRPKLLIDVSLTRECPLLATVMLVCSSPALLDTLPLVGTSTVTTTLRNRLIRGENRKYRLGTVNDPGPHPGIDVT